MMNINDWGYDMVIIWATVLTHKHITKAEFMTAKNQSFLCKYPPTNAEVFLELARGNNTSGYPDPEEAYRHAVDYAGRLPDDRKHWQHVVIFETARRIGMERLASQRGLKRLWCQTYGEVCTAYDNGAKFEIPQPLQIERKPTTPAKAKAYLAQLKKRRVVA